MLNNIENNFFIIDSENISNIESKIYGYVVADDKIHFTDSSLLKEDLNGNGTYVSIFNDSNTITISQDNTGSYGLYLFESDKYFAISNSFIKLAKYVKEKFELTFNENYAKTLMSTEETSVFDETLINEIKIIPRNCNILIDVNSKKMDYEFIIYEKTVELDSKEGVLILDKWFNKWIRILRDSFKENILSIDCYNDLTSLILIALLINANIDLKSVNVDLSNLSENSRKLFTQIAEKYNFSIGVTPNPNNVQDIDIPINHSFYTKLGFKKESNFCSRIHEKTVVSLNDCEEYYLKNYGADIENFIHNMTDNANEYSSEFSETVEKYLWKNIHKVQKHCRYYDVYSKEFSKIFFKETLFRNQFGKNNVEEYLSNKINLNPLIDTQLQNININKKILLLTIINRYLPEMSGYVEQYYDEKSSVLSKQINQKYSYKEVKYDYLEVKNKHNDIESGSNVAINEEISHFLTKIFFSDAFKFKFLKYFPKEAYDNIIQIYLIPKKSFISEVYAVVAIVKIIDYIEYSQYRKQTSEMDWLKSYITIDNKSDELNVPLQNMLNQYLTARIDVKNNGSFSNQIGIFDVTDRNVIITKPSWYTNEKGEGQCINSTKGKISFKIKCIGDGELRLELRTLDVRDRNNRRFPVYIDYLNFKVDDKEILKENKLAWHNKPIKYSKKVFDGEIIKVDIRWQPFTRLSKYVN